MRRGEGRERPSDRIFVGAPIGVYVRGEVFINIWNREWTTATQPNCAIVSRNLWSDRLNFSRIAKERILLEVVRRQLAKYGTLRDAPDMISRNFRNRGTFGISTAARIAEQAKEGETKRDKRAPTAPSRAISTAHRARLVAHNDNSVRLGSFPSVQYYHSYRDSDRPKYNCVKQLA